MSCAKTAELLDMLFGIWILEGQWSQVSNESAIRPMQRGKDMAGHAQGHSAMSCAKMDEPIEMLCGLWTWHLDWFSHFAGLTTGDRLTDRPHYLAGNNRTHLHM